MTTTTSRATASNSGCVSKKDGKVETKACLRGTCRCTHQCWVADTDARTTVRTRHLSHHQLLHHSCHLHSTPSRVCASVTCPSVGLFHRLTAAAASGWFAAECPACKRCRSTATGMLRAPCCRCAGSQQQTRAVSRWEPRNEAPCRLVHYSSVAAAAVLVITSLSWLMQFFLNRHDSTICTAPQCLYNSGIFSNKFIDLVSAQSSTISVTQIITGINIYIYIYIYISLFRQKGSTYIIHTQKSPKYYQKRNTNKNET